MKAKIRGKKYILELSESEVAAISAALDSVASFDESEAYRDVVKFFDVFGWSIYRAKKEGQMGEKEEASG